MLRKYEEANFLIKLLPLLLLRMSKKRLANGLRSCIEARVETIVISISDDRRADGRLIFINIKMPIGISQNRARGRESTLLMLIAFIDSHPRDLRASFNASIRPSRGSLPFIYATISTSIVRFGGIYKLSA